MEHWNKCFGSRRLQPAVFIYSRRHKVCDYISNCLDCRYSEGEHPKYFLNDSAK